MILHDWVLEGINMDWAEGIVSLPVRSPHGQAEIACKGITEVVLARRMAWGPSESIYQLKVESGINSNMRRAIIEMQFGDTITITAKEIVLPPE